MENKEIIFTVSDPDTLSDALKEISNMEDRANQEVRLNIEVSEKYDKSFVIPEGCDDIHVYIETDNFLNNYYEIFSGRIIVREVRKNIPPFTIQSFENTFKFFKNSSFKGYFYDSVLMTYDNTNGVDCYGNNVYVSMYNKSILNLSSAGKCFVTVTDKAIYIGSSEGVDIYKEGIAYIYHNVEARIFSSEATVYAFDNSQVNLSYMDIDCYKANIHLYDRSSALLYHDAKNLTCHDESIVYVYYDYQGNNPRYRTADRFKNEPHWYKVVIKDSLGIYHSICDFNFTYRIGEIVKPNGFDENPYAECSHGIHLSTLKYAITFGITSNCKNLVILELTPTPDAKIVIPYESEGKIRVSEAKVLREVPLEELGEFKTIAKSRMFAYSEEV